MSGSREKHSQGGFLNQLTNIPSKPATQLMLPVQKLSHCTQRLLGTLLNLMNNILAESSYQYSQCIQIYLDSCETKQNRTKTKAEAFDKYFLPVFGTKLNTISLLYNDDEMLPTQATLKKNIKSTTNILSLEDMCVIICRAGSSDGCSHTRWECESLWTAQESFSKKKNSNESIFEECDSGKSTKFRAASSSISPAVMKWFLAAEKEMESGDVMGQQSAVFMANGSCHRTNFILFFNKITSTVVIRSGVGSVLCNTLIWGGKNGQNQCESITNGLKIADGKILKWLGNEGFINE